MVLLQIIHIVDLVFELVNKMYMLLKDLEVYRITT
jgi:hypothetical protein